jgi:Sulfotransferase family
MSLSGEVVSARPNLFLIGAMKSGTTSLNGYLASHPQVFMAPSKEPTHFVDGDELKSVSKAIWNMGYWRDRSRYLQQFSGAGDAVVLGEASTNYSKLPRITGVARRIAEFNPHARILYLMRDPIERTLSHYWHNAKYHDERRDILKAVQREPHYREVSHYAMQIEPFLELFGPGQVKALTLETLKNDPVTVLQGLFRWLGVDDSHEPPDLARRNATGEEIMGAHRLPALRRIRRWRHWDRVGPLIPKPIRSAGRWLAERKRKPAAVDTGRVADYLRPIQQDETRELTRLLGREFPEWTTLFAPGVESVGV